MRCCFGPFRGAPARFARMVKLAPADGDDDFELIAIAQALPHELASRNNLAVAFQSNTLVAKRHVLEQLRDRYFTVKLS